MKLLSHRILVHFLIVFELQTISFTLMLTAPFCGRGFGLWVKRAPKHILTGYLEH